MNIHEALSDTNISRMIELSEICKDKLGGNYYSSMIKRNYKNGYDAEVKTKDGQTYRVKVKHHSPDFKTVNWK